MVHIYSYLKAYNRDDLKWVVSFKMHFKGMTSWTDFGAEIALNTTNINMLGFYVVPQMELVDRFIMTVNLTTPPVSICFDHEL